MLYTKFVGYGHIALNEKYNALNEFRNLLTCSIVNSTSYSVTKICLSDFVRHSFEAKIKCRVRAAVQKFANEFELSYNHIDVFQLFYYSISDYIL